MSDPAIHDDIPRKILRERIKEKMTPYAQKHRERIIAENLKYENQLEIEGLEKQLDEAVPKFLSKHRDEILNLRPEQSKDILKGITILTKIVEGYAHAVPKNQLALVPKIFASNFDELSGEFNRGLAKIVELCKKLDTARPTSMEAALADFWQKHGGTIKKVLRDTEKLTYTYKEREYLLKVFLRFEKMDGRSYNEKKLDVTTQELLWDNYYVDAKKLQGVINRKHDLLGLKKVADYLETSATIMNNGRLTEMAQDYRWMVLPAITRDVTARTAAGARR